MKQVIIALLSLMWLVPQAHAQQTQQFQASITDVETSQGDQVIELTNPDGKTFEVVYPEGTSPNHLVLEAGNSVFVEQYAPGQVEIIDMVRHVPVFVLFLLFIGVVIAVAGWQGIRSIIGMAASFIVLFQLLLPGIVAGYNPVVVTILASCLIVPLLFYLSHGNNKKTLTAALGTISALILTGILALIFTDWSLITGLVSDELSFLQLYFPVELQAKGLILSGIIIGLLGVLDDVTITQASLVFKLKQTNPNMPKNELFKNAMDVGRDHIASVVNTLVLVYVGASLPLLLFFMTDSVPFMQAISTEVVVEEIVRMLVGSIGLILAIPLTTLIALWFHGTPEDATGGCDHNH